MIWNENATIKFIIIVTQAASLVRLATILQDSTANPKDQPRYEVTEIVDEGPPPNKTLKWMLMPNGRDNVEPAVISGVHNETHRDSVDHVKFYLYTRNNEKRAEVGIMNDTCLPIFRHFKPKRKTVVLIHGYADSVKESYMVPFLKDAFLARKNYNIFAVDWSPWAKAPWYWSASHHTKAVARRTASFIDYLNTNKRSRAEDFHLIGFSLGAHVAGLTGRYLKTGRVMHITGLDPAWILFSSGGADSRLDHSHANLVEVVHTSGGYLGFEEPLGHRDFYPNGGVWPQPGCVIDYAAVCSHRRSFYYYGEAIMKGYGFRGIKCETYADFAQNKCSEKYNTTLELGRSPLNERYNGRYFFETKPKFPFAQKKAEDEDYFDNYVENDKDLFDY